jgi:3-methylfumaryl-CoA hydratase
VEGFPELLVHGPLTCTMLLNLIHESNIKWDYPASFYYRAISPLFANHKMELSIKWSTDQKSCKLNAVNSESKTLGMTGTFTASPLSSTLRS